MKNLEINVSFIPISSIAKYPVPFVEEVFYGPGLKKIGRVVFENASPWRSHIILDENATGEEVQEIIEWVRGVLKKITL